MRWLSAVDYPLAKRMPKTKARNMIPGLAPLRGITAPLRDIFRKGYRKMPV